MSDTEAGVDEPDVKKRRALKAAAFLNGSYLEAQEDVDAFLEMLRQALEVAIAADERIEIRLTVSVYCNGTRNQTNGI